MIARLHPVPCQLRRAHAVKIWCLSALHLYILSDRLAAQSAQMLHFARATGIYLDSRQHMVFRSLPTRVFCLGMVFETVVSDDDARQVSIVNIIRANFKAS